MKLRYQIAISVLTALVLTVAVEQAFSQTAKVIALSPEDAKQAESLYQQKKDIEDKIAKLEDLVKNKYLIEGVPLYMGCVFIEIANPYPNQTNLHYCRLAGWEGGFQFSEDFKFIVPKPPVLHGDQWNIYPSCGSGFLAGCIQLTPSPWALTTPWINSVVNTH